MLEGTIVAISTSTMGIGAISIVRLSGDKAVEIADKIMSIDLLNVKSRVMSHAFLHVAGDSGQIIDDGLVVVFRAPNSFTKEDVVEVNCHGGMMSANTLVEELIKCGARMAEAGEFSMRAFVNGSIMLTQAEAIDNIIHSKTKTALLSAANNLSGGLSLKIRNIRQTLVDISAHILAIMDFPDEGVDEISQHKTIETIEQVEQEIRGLIDNADKGIIINNGLNVAIIGSPNVGKSSLLNALLQDERAIVTDAAGTTRDVICEQANIGGALINFADTAGVRGETDDEIEKIGIDRTKKKAMSADLILKLFDYSSTAYDEEILNLAADIPHIIVASKSDLPKKLELAYDIKISTKNGEGLDDLQKMIAEFAPSADLNDSPVANTRQKAKLLQALPCVSNLLDMLKNDATLDCVTVELEGAITQLGEIIGENVSDDIVTSIFSNFCVGK